VMLRTKVAILLSELAVPPPPGGLGSVSRTIQVLLGRGVLDDKTARALNEAVEIADQAASGARVPLRVGVAVQNSGTAILEQLAFLRTIAAARFEDYVLTTLQDQLPGGWSADIDRSIASDAPPELQEGPAADRGFRHVRVDALVTAGGSDAVIEVRARLQPGAPGQIEAVRTWVEALPTRLPIVLVMLGDSLTRRELQHITGSHEGPLEILQWDTDSGLLISVLAGVLINRDSAASIIVPAPA
jgi:hypothetical protein